MLELVPFTTHGSGMAKGPAPTPLSPVFNLININLCQCPHTMIGPSNSCLHFRIDLVWFDTISAWFVWTASFKYGGSIVETTRLLDFSGSPTNSGSVVTCGPWEDLPVNTRLRPGTPRWPDMMKSIQHPNARPTYNIRTTAHLCTN
jgi:hypothetical protein